jgi:hypothetical protein
VSDFESGYPWRWLQGSDEAAGGSSLVRLQGSDAAWLACFFVFFDLDLLHLLFPDLYLALPFDGIRSMSRNFSDPDLLFRPFFMGLSPQRGNDRMIQRWHRDDSLFSPAQPSIFLAST